MKRIFLLLVLLLGFINIICPSKVNAYPSNAMVKVGIMDQKFTTVEKTEVTIYSTTELVLSDTKTKSELARIPQGANLKISKADDGKYYLYYIDPSTEIEMEASVDDDFVITAPNGVLGIKDLIRGGKPAMYRGEFRIVSVPNKPNKFYLINCLDVEYYLKGVVPCEMPVGFGLEALKSQAVAARVYSLTPRTKMSRAYDVVDSVASQVYNGYNRESEISNEAIDKTHGLVALSNDEMIIAVFSSTAGGYTESYSNTFSDPITKQFPSPPKKDLVATPDLPDIKPLNNEEDAYKFYSTKPQSYDVHSPLYRWTRTWTRSELQNVLKTTLVVQSKTGFVEPKLTKSEDFGNLKDIKVTKRGNSGKIISMDIVTDKNTFTVKKELVIRRTFQKNGKALPSANVVFRGLNNGNNNNNTADKKADDNNKDNTAANNSKQSAKPANTTTNNDIITAYGGGFGHGCGLSQFGARYMAQDCHLPFDTILSHYYKGIVLGTKPIEIGKSAKNVCFYQPFKKATLVIPNSTGLKQLLLNINGQDVCYKFSGSGRIENDISKYIKQNEVNVIKYNPANQPKNHRTLSAEEHKIEMYVKVSR